MPTRKLVCTDNRIIGQAPNDVRLVRWSGATDAEGVTLNTGTDGIVLVWRLDPAADVSAWPVGSYLYLTDSPTP